MRHGSARYFRHLTAGEEVSRARRLLGGLYLANGALGLALWAWFVAAALWSGKPVPGPSIRYALVLGALALWSVSSLWIGRRLQRGTRRGVIVGALLHVGTSLATLPAPSEAPVAIGISVLSAIGLAFVWRELV
jgi:hypothetical protein